MLIFLQAFNGVDLTITFIYIKMVLNTCSIKIKPVILDLQHASTAEIFKGSSFVPLGEHRL